MMSTADRDQDDQQHQSEQESGEGVVSNKAYSLDYLDIIESNSSLTEGTNPALTPKEEESGAVSSPTSEAAAPAPPAPPASTPLASNVTADYTAAAHDNRNDHAANSGASETTKNEPIHPFVSYISSASSTPEVPRPYTQGSTQSSKLAATTEEPTSSDVANNIAQQHHSQSEQQSSAPSSKKPPQQYPPSPKHLPSPMTTIDNSSPRNSVVMRRDSDDLLNIPPVHAFFHQHPYDSDGSNESFVQRARASSGSSHGGGGTNGTSRRERNLSFDSMASGSVQTGSANAPPQSQHRQHQSQPPPQMLPYRERRKLMQLRQQQQQHQRTYLQHHHYSASSSHPSPQHLQQPTKLNASTGGGQPPPLGNGMPDPRLFAPGMTTSGYPPPPPYQQQQQQHQQQTQGGMPPPMPQYPGPPMDPATMAAYMNMYGMPPPPPPQFAAAMGYPPYPGYPPGYPFPPHQQHPQQQHPQQQQHPGYPYRPLAPPPNNAPSPQHQQQQHSQGGMPTPAPPLSYGYPSPPLPSATRGGNGTSSQSDPSKPSSANVQPRLSPYGSLGKQAPPATERRPPKHSRLSPRPPVSGKHTATDRLPPPPPPPLPSSSQHAHSDSTGSISTMGSMIRQQQQQHLSPLQQNRQNSVNNGSFLEMLRSQWTPEQSPKAAVSFTTRGGSGGGGGRWPSPQQQHRRLSSQDDRPPASRGTHKRLTSISNDNWEERNQEDSDDEGSTAGKATGKLSSTGEYSSSSDMEDQRRSQYFQEQRSWHGPGSDKYYDENPLDERTSLLPPPGISTNERDGSRWPPSSRQLSRHDQHRRHPSQEAVPTDVEPDNLAATDRFDNRSNVLLTKRSSTSSHRKKRKKKHKRKRKSSRHYQQQVSDSSSEDDAANYDYRQWTQKRARMLDKERAKLIAQWKAEAREEAEFSMREQDEHRLYRKLRRCLDGCWAVVSIQGYRLMVALETCVANLPLTIGAVAMAVVTLGVVWFKFAEENLSTCERVQFHSSQCSFPEFPGCFYCDTNADLYQLALGFHFGCNILAGLLAMLFALKVLVATRVVLDEMSSPTTASPAGLLCMTTVCVFAGRGSVGQFMVTTAASIHMCLVLWFVYMALAYRIMPDPSWFPNTVGVGLSAVKMWLYYPIPGHLLMAVSLTSNFFFFPISLIRVAINEKISATVGWMQMNAPAISLYALTIMAQPSFEEEHPDVTHFQRVHRMVYLPCMHVMAALSILGFVASCHSLWNRWGDFRKKEFSPAHAAFCFPVLSHANALQAYRGAIISFSKIQPRSWRMVTLYVYWFSVLTAGTIATLWITARFLYCLPRWTNLDVTDEEEPPSPNETFIAMRDMVTAGDAMRQPFVSPAVLQANETGALVLARTGPEGPLRYVRTRRLAALGFEPSMNWSEMQEEREVLLDWVRKHPPRRRHRTLSVPGLDFSYGARLGTDNSGVYGAVDWTPGGRTRADTSSPRVYY